MSLAPSHFARTRIASSIALLVGITASCTSVGSSSASPFRSAPAPADRPSLLISIMGGSRSLDDDVAWDEIDQPAVFGLESASLGDPLGLEVGLSFATDDTTVSGVDVTNSFLETWVGGRATFGDGPLLPYVGAGLSLVLARVEGESGGTSVSDDDTGVGLYLHAGVLYLIGGRFFVGVDARILTGASVELFGIDTDADYTQIAGVVGWGI